MSDTLELSQAVDDTVTLRGWRLRLRPFEGVKWRIKIGDKEYGPYPRSRLIDFLKEGRVQAGSFIACGNGRRLPPRRPPPQPALGLQGTEEAQVRRSAP